MPSSLFGGRIRGLEKAQRDLGHRAEAARGDRGLETATRLALAQLHRYATGIVHVQTGRLKNSLFWQIERTNRSQTTGIVATTVDYAAIEHDRGGSHAFFRRTVREEGPHVRSLFAGSAERSLTG